MTSRGRDRDPRPEVAGAHGWRPTTRWSSWPMLVRRFGPARERLLSRRQETPGSAFDRARSPTFCPRRVRGPAGELDRRRRRRPTSTDRRVEITGPVERKMMINALNSGARVFMADFEDALSSARGRNVVDGPAQLHGRGPPHAGLRPAPRASATGWASDSPRWWSGRGDGTSTRSTCWWTDARPRPSLCDFGFYFYHNARELLARGSGPYFYLPKLETTWRPGSGTRSSRPRSAAAGPSAGDRSGRRCWSRRFWPRSRWTRSCTSCASMPPVSTPDDGTTSSASSRTSAIAPSSSCPIGPSSP